MRLASTALERQAAYRLRFRVFNLELNEGLESAYATGLDTDPFDPVCDHLIVEDSLTGEIVGTYRMQTGSSATRNIGYYCATEFDLSPFAAVRDRVLELGRACVHRDHRSFEVITLLWSGIAEYALGHGCQYLIGCSSLTSQDEAYGAAMYRKLESNLVEASLRTSPRPECAIPSGLVYAGIVTPPKLLRTYLTLGAKICGPPAIDREFKTIDFLTFLDLESLNGSARQRFLSI